MKELKIKIPAVFRPLTQMKKRIKLCYGGRAGGKSYAFADSLLVLGRMKKLFIVCLREIQSSIKDSVHKLLADRIAHYQLSDYQVYDTKIENKVTGTVFVFKGLRDQDPQKIKSLEGADIAWIEEAQTISKKSWDILEPTIRKPDSEIWISMNREAENDAVWVAVAAQPDENTWAKIRGILEKEKATYQETRQIFEEKEIKKGQMVLPVYIVDDVINPSRDKLTYLHALLRQCFINKINIYFLC